MKKPIISERNKGITALILLALAFASMGIFVRFLTDVSLFQQVYLRVFIALILGVILFYKDLRFSKLKTLHPKEWAIVAFRGIAMYIGVTFFSQAILLTTYSNVSFIGALPMVAILGVIFFKEKLTLKKTLFILMAFVGVLLVAVKDFQSIFHWGTGEMLAFIAVFFFSISYVTRKWNSTALNNKEITTLMFFFGGLAILLISLIAGEGLPTFKNAGNGLIVTLFFAGVFNVINLYLTNYGFQKVDALLANNLLTLESLFAILLGMFFFQEIPTLKSLIGGVIIIVSVIGMNRLERKE